MKQRHIDSVTHTNYDNIKKRYNNIVLNTKRLNNLKTKKVKLGNGEKTYFFKRPDQVLREVTLIHDKFGWDLYITDFTEGA